MYRYCIPSLHLTLTFQAMNMQISLRAPYRDPKVKIFWFSLLVLDVTVVGGGVSEVVMLHHFVRYFLKTKKGVA